MGEVASNLQRTCCGDSEDPEVLSQLQDEAKVEGEHEATDSELANFLLEIEQEQRSHPNLNKNASDALDSFLRHQFSEITPEVIMAGGLDPIEKVWTHSVRSLIFEASITLSTLRGLSNITFDELKVDDAELRYNETLSLNTIMFLTIKSRDSEPLSLDLEASIGINPRGNLFDVAIPAEGRAYIHGATVQCAIGL